MPFLRNEFSKNFEDFFYDGVIYRNDSYKRSTEKIKLKVKDMRLTSLTPRQNKLKGSNKSIPTAWE